MAKESRFEPVMNVIAGCWKSNAAKAWAGFQGPAQRGNLQPLQQLHKRPVYVI
jgi:hypothetical protein